MRFLVLFTAAVSACAQTLPPLFDTQNAADWLSTTYLSQVQVDAAGDVYFAGTVPIANTVPATHTLGNAGLYDIVVLKMDSRLEQVRYVTVIGGGEALSGFQVDGEGHAFLAGRAASRDFPATKRLPGTAEDFAGFVLKLSADGDKVEYGLLMPMEPSVFALGADGGVYIGGIAASGQVPITPGAYLTQSPRQNATAGYVMGLRAADGEIEFATWVQQPILNTDQMVARRNGGVAFVSESTLVALNGSGSQANFSLSLNSVKALLAVDLAGNFYVYGNSRTFNRLNKYSPDGTLIQTTDLGQGFSPTEITVGDDGTAYLSGVTTAYMRTLNSLEPCRANRTPSPNQLDPGNAFVVVGPTGSVTYSGFMTGGFQAIVVPPGGRYLFGPSGGLGAPDHVISQGLVRLDLRQIPATPRFSPACLANGASYALGRVTPGEIMTIYGSGIGPQTGSSFALVNGRVPTELAGVSVTVDGVSAPVLYAQDGQINYIVPWQTRPSGIVPVCVTRAGDRLCLQSVTSPLEAAVFGDAAGPIVVLPDGKLTNQVPSGGYFTVYMTGTGLLDGAVDDGGVSGFLIRQVVAQGRAQVFSTDLVCGPTGNCQQKPAPDAQIAYVGNSPGLVWGVTQMNVKLPALDPGSYVVRPNFTGSGSVPVIEIQVVP